MTRWCFQSPIKMEKVPLNSGGKSEYGLIESDIHIRNNSNRVPSIDFLPQKFWTRVIPAVGFVALVSVVAFIFFRSSGETVTPIEGNLQATAELETVAYIDLEAKQGRIRGYVRNTRQGRNYLAFYKIPFAQPPVGSLRFQEPSLQALGKPQCLQRIKYSPVIEAGGEEDCLNLNLYTPSVQNKSAFPTMVYIHGGGFTDGNGSRYGAEYFLDENVVLITIHYRLAALGFLNSEDGVFPGNVGFKDQLMALRWVKTTLLTGGMSVAFQMVSPLSSGLFHQAISQSGASVCNTLDLFSDNPLQRLREVAEELNCPSNGTTAEIMECFMSKPASEIAIARPSAENGHFAASIDTNSPNSPYKILKDKKANSVPYILGIVTAEWLFDALAVLHDPELVKNLNENWADFAGELLTLKDVTNEELDSIKTFYFGENLIGNETTVNLTNLISDRTVNHCSYMSATMHAQLAESYLYYISKPPAKSYAEKVDPNFNAKSYGFLAHADELQYQFPYYGYPEIPFGDPEYYHFSEYFIKLWAQFAATGNPSGMNGLEWQSSPSREGAFWFELNDNPGRTHILDERMQFWDQFTDSQLKLE
ncbi:Esterase FE4 [Orchesella cincta]|uniref:Esterase FE4 n=1 Tax=Orchesella cincta TaxID=48709 RepID=A0A1D2M8U4_ORCCI|nr:Esterase FE4 [Orchesella cincta]